MGALFGFVGFWVVLLIGYGIYAMLRWIVENLPESGWFALIVCGIADFIDWTVKHTRNFFARMFSNTKRWVYELETEGRKAREH